MESCTQCLKNELKPENAGLNHEDPSVFVKSQWPFDQRLYVLYRVVVAMGFIAWIIADIIDETEKFYKDRFWIWFIFATNWSFILLTLTTIMEAICCSYYYVAARGLLDSHYLQTMPIPLKVLWLLYNLAANTAIVITISYWSYIFFMEHSRFLMTTMSKMKHMMNTVYVIVDLMLACRPIRIFHMLFPVMLGSIYAIFNATYFLNDGTILDGRHYAYNVLNWNVPAEAIVTCILCIAQSIFSQVVLYHLAAARLWLHSRFYERPEQLPEHDSEMQSIISADSTTYLATDSQLDSSLPAVANTNSSSIGGCINNNTNSSTANNTATATNNTAPNALLLLSSSSSSSSTMGGSAGSTAAMTTHNNNNNNNVH
ncbi:protein rolling stone-like [Argonauta hians]